MIYIALGVFFFINGYLMITALKDMFYDMEYEEDEE